MKLTQASNAVVGPASINAAVGSRPTNTTVGSRSTNTTVGSRSTNTTVGSRPTNTAVDSTSTVGATPASLWSPTRWAVLISGRGSNLAALLDLRDEIDIRVVVSSEAKAYGLARARRAGVPIVLTPYKPDGRKIDWSSLTDRLEERGVTDLFLAGFMRILPPSFVEHWRGRILNLHPSLLPAYPGLQSIARAYVDGSDLGVTVHEVTEEVDAGRIILQRRTVPSIEQQSLQQESLQQHGSQKQSPRPQSPPPPNSNVDGPTSHTGRLNPSALSGYSLAEAEFLVHVDEQRVIKQATRMWRALKIPRGNS